jgi:hypothetical protein
MILLWSFTNIVFLWGSDVQGNKEAIVVMIIWYLDLQLPVQSLPIITKVVSLKPVHGEVYSIQHYHKVVSDL